MLDLILTYFAAIKYSHPQSELERERIALELQAEKKAQATREQRLQEQARKIANLSTMVLYSAKDPREKYPKKVTDLPWIYFSYPLHFAV